MRIYLTHCSAKKDDSSKGSGKKVTPDKLYIEYVCTWNKVPGNDERRLRKFLMTRFDANWVENAEIKKIDYEDAILFSLGQNSAEIRLSKDKATVKINESNKRSKLEVNEEEGDRKIYYITKTQRFMRICKTKNVNWAIFSDLYGVWFSEIEHEWYGDDVGDPNKVSEEKFLQLLRDFDQKLQDYDEIWFYYNPGRFHPLYERLLQETSLRDKVNRFTHIREIV